MTLNPFTRRYLAPIIGVSLLVSVGVAQNAVRGITTGVTALVPEPPQFVGLSIDPRIIKRFLGIRVLVADLVWIDTLIKADIVREDQPFTGLYRAFKTIVLLDPDNLYAYYISGLYLSVVKDDIKGATAILRDGVEHMIRYPDTLQSWENAWQLPFMLGYNLLFEEHEAEAGSKWMQHAGEMPKAPPYVRKLAQTISTERGMLEVAARVLADSRERMTRPEQRQAIEKKMLDVAVRQEVVELNERFKSFLESTQAYALPRKRAFLLFMKTNGHSGKDMLSRTLSIDSTGRIAPVLEN